MSEYAGPSIVRRPSIVRSHPAALYVKPGLHSYNGNRGVSKDRSNRSRALSSMRMLLLLIGVGALGYYSYVAGDQYVYQAYQNWAFDQQIAGRTNVAFADYLRERTPFGLLTGAAMKVAIPSAANAPGQAARMRPPEGSLLGRVEIPRLNLSAMVREGVDAKTLNVAVGHVPSTAAPGQMGNFAIAAHRDTLFRALKDIRNGDIVTFESTAGTYKYQVVATVIVKPSDVRVLRPDGGGLISASEEGLPRQDPSRLLTMITCYPFYYVGSAPKRFIVEARLIPTASERATEGGSEGQKRVLPRRLLHV